MSSKTISIVVPVYNEAKNLPNLYKELQKHTKSLPYSFEFIFVDDGSQDESADVIRGLIKQDKRRIRFVELSRNFGKEVATSAGLHRAKGDAAMMIDADMQMPPSLIGKFIDQWEDGSEIVVGVFSGRSMSWFRRTGARFYYKIMGRIAHTKIKPNATDFRLLDRKVVRVFRQLSEHDRMTRGLIDWLGFKRSYIYFKQQPREHGDPTYSVGKLFGLAMNGFTSYSMLPLKLAGILGVILLLTSIPLGIFLFVQYVMNDPMHWGIDGTTMLTMVTMILVGLVLTCLGLISLYIAHIHSEVKNRPLYVVRNDIDGDGSHVDASLLEGETA